MKYEPRYNKSRALIIGINKYQHAQPLDYATNDADAIAGVLGNQYDFREEDIMRLKDSEASRNNILEAFHKYTQEGTSPDDKLVIFFAGHGHTVSGNRGEVGFLVPVDGDRDNTATLIRWDELILNSELISAKHILFIMDACYGGLAFKRALPTGT
ncbi:MAG: caspase family protein, partial [Sedimentisphaerales bacterium]